MAEGYKAWAANDILNAADLNDYASTQSVMRFANAAGRDAALTSLVVKEGMVAYLKDSNILTVNTDGTTSGWREVSPAETSSLKDASVTEAKIANGAVTTGKIADGTIVNADISASAAIDSDKLVAGGAWTSYTPVWTNNGSVSLAGGSSGKYWVLGKTVHMVIDITAASANTGGAGAWTFSIPLGTIKGSATGSGVRYTVATTGYFSYIVLGQNAGTTVNIVPTSTSAQFFMFGNIATGDRIVLSCTYERN